VLATQLPVVTAQIRIARKVLHNRISQKAVPILTVRRKPARQSKTYKILIEKGVSAVFNEFLVGGSIVERTVSQAPTVHCFVVILAMSTDAMQQAYLRGSNVRFEEGL
jgi:hypothetical protein